MNHPCAAQALQLLYDAEINRAVGSHAMNVASSRSHLVVTAHVTVREPARHALTTHGGASLSDDGGDGGGSPNGTHAVSEERFAKLHLVDLAGSERIKLTASRGATATVREASYINKSLTFLEQVVMALGEGGRDHVPYRSSKLTHVLKDSLGGMCRTVLVACLWPDAAQLDQTSATLRFAARMGRIACAPVANKRRADHRERARYGLLLGKLRAEVDALRSELAVRDLIRGSPPPAYAYGPCADAEELGRVRRDAKAFLDGGDRPPVVTVGQVHATYDALRDFLRANDEGRRSPQRPPPSPARAAAAAVPRLELSSSHHENTAPPDPNAAASPSHHHHHPERAAPPRGHQPPAKKDPVRSSKDRRPPAPATRPPPPPGGGGAPQRPAPGQRTPLTSSALAAHTSRDSEAQFARWRETNTDRDTLEIEAELADCKEKQKDVKRRAKHAAADVNDAKKKIDALVARVSEAREARGDGGDGSPEQTSPSRPDDRDDRLLVKRLKDVKREYRAAFDLLSQTKAEATHVDARRKYLFRILVARFQADSGAAAAVHHDASNAPTSERGALQVHPAF